MTTGAFLKYDLPAGKIKLHKLTDLNSEHD